MEEHEVHTTYRPRRTSRTVYYDTPTYSYDSPVYTSPSSASASVFPSSATDAAFHDGLTAARFEALTVAGVAYLVYSEHMADMDADEEDEQSAREVYDEELKATRRLMATLKEEHAQTDPLVSAIQKPLSGTYEGFSAEDDGGDQGVMTHLTFREDGTVEGWGEDVEDGRYVIEDGVWSTSAGATVDESVRPGGRVAWVEKYDKGFEVALRGQVLADGTIRAMWASTFGVAGSVDLVKHE